MVVCDDGSATVDGEPVPLEAGATAGTAVLDALHGYARERNTAVTADVHDPSVGRLASVEVAPDGSSRLLDGCREHRLRGEQPEPEAGSPAVDDGRGPADGPDDAARVARPPLTPRPAPPPRIGRGSVPRQSDEEFQPPGLLHRPLFVGPMALGAAATLVMVPLMLLGGGESGDVHDARTARAAGVTNPSRSAVTGDPATTVPRSAGKTPSPDLSATEPGTKRKGTPKAGGPEPRTKDTPKGTPDARNGGGGGTEPVADEPPQAPVAVKPPHVPGAVKPPQAPVAVKPPHVPGAVKPPQAPVAVKPPHVPGAVKPPHAPVIVKPPHAPGAGTPPHAPVTVEPPQDTAATAVNRLAESDPSGRHICYRVHLSGQGWQKPVCDGETAGTTGPNEQITALNIAVTGTSGSSADAFLHDPGSTDRQGRWAQRWTDVVADGKDNYIGSTKKGAPYMTGFAIEIGSGQVCQTTKVRGDAWSGWGCADARPGFIFGGTRENERRLEAVRLTV
ncbi:hypothetical protein [Streptomyces anandii]|uniref:hypothetical protein n=1 Tax=Streptomyces anandii TaxID=285454 RepID=UPI0037AE3D19